MYAPVILPAIPVPDTETVRLAIHARPIADSVPDVTITTTQTIARAVTPIPIRTHFLLPATIMVASEEVIQAALAAVVEVTVEEVEAEAVAVVINQSEGSEIPPSGRIGIKCFNAISLPEPIKKL